MSEARKYANELMSKFPYAKDVGFFDYQIIVQKAQELIIESCPDSNKEILKNIPTIVLSAGDVDIFCSQVPQKKDEAIVVIGHRYIMFIQIMINLSIWFIENNKKVNNQIISETGYVLAEFFAYLYVKRPIDRIPEYMLPKNVDSELSIDLFFHSICFLLAHEYSHILNGHLHPKNSHKISIEKAGYINVYKTFQEFELEADIKGTEILLSLNSLSKLSQASPFVVIALLGCLDHMTLLCETIVLKQLEKAYKSASMEEIQGILKRRLSRSTHLQAEERYKKTFERFKNKVEPISLGFSNAFLNFLVTCMYEFDEKSLGIIQECSNKLIDFQAHPSEGFISNLEFIGKEYSKIQKDKSLISRILNFFTK